MFRRSLMQHENHGIGLTALYNLVHDESERGGDVVRLREIHVEIDEAVREAYAQDEDRGRRCMSSRPG
jgi:hypothetical protein